MLIKKLAHRLRNRDWDDALIEIGIVVLGILIAIQLDASQQRFQERKLEKNYIVNLIEDVRFDLSRGDGWFSRFDGKVGGLLAAKDYYFGERSVDDPLSFLTEVSLGGVGSRGEVVSATATYAELISTGNIRYFRDDRLKAEILNYYGYKIFVETYLTNLRTEYATYMNSSLPYAPGGRLAPDPRDLSIALERLKRQEFLALVNQELTWAYSVDSVVRRHLAQARTLIASLESYLETF
jgi:hypothetical protein